MEIFMEEKQIIAMLWKRDEYGLKLLQEQYSAKLMTLAWWHKNDMRYRNLYHNQCCTRQIYQLSVAIFYVRWHGWNELFPAIHGNSLSKSCFILHCSVLSGYCNFCNNHFLIQLTGFKNLC